MIRVGIHTAVALERSSANRNTTNVIHGDKRSTSIGVEMSNIPHMRMLPDHSNKLDALAVDLFEVKAEFHSMNKKIIQHCSELFEVKAGLVFKYLACFVIGI